MIPNILRGGRAIEKLATLLCIVGCDSFYLLEITPEMLFPSTWSFKRGSKKLDDMCLPSSTKQTGNLIGTSGLASELKTSSLHFTSSTEDCMLLSEEPPSATAVSSAFFNFNAFCFVSTASGPTVASDNILASDLKTYSIASITSSTKHCNCLLSVGETSTILNGNDGLAKVVEMTDDKGVEDNSSLIGGSKNGNNDG
ncbi:hypothetical protein H0E87_017444 [Populus deltoides]|uniref:Uncharacterized protein n=1 Tax=Populus deltoides TaxID=3696 RepID=A0A8T2Y0A4_POPDE|nr:hypothetical protein H0E87_017444 [Populus deltoides]